MAGLNTSEIMALAKEWHGKAPSVGMSNANAALGDIAKCVYYLAQKVRELENLTTVKAKKSTKKPAKKKA